VCQRVNYALIDEFRFHIGALEVDHRNLNQVLSFLLLDNPLLDESGVVLDEQVHHLADLFVREKSLDLAEDFCIFERAESRNCDIWVSAGLES
jgi:hypothetical protein